MLFAGILTFIVIIKYKTANDHNVSMTTIVSAGWESITEKRLLSWFAELSERFIDRSSTGYPSNIPTDHEALCSSASLSWTKSVLHLLCESFAQSRNRPRIERRENKSEIREGCATGWDIRCYVARIRWTFSAVRLARVRDINNAISPFFSAML